MRKFDQEKGFTRSTSAFFRFDKDFETSISQKSKKIAPVLEMSKHCLTRP